MLGSRPYLLASSGLALLLGLLWAALFAAKGPDSLLFAAAGWAPVALVGVFGGTLAVRFHGTAGSAFPLTLVTCILLRLFLGLGGVALALMSEQVSPYLTTLFGTFASMQVFEMVWFIRRGRLFRDAPMNPAR